MFSFVSIWAIKGPPPLLSQSGNRADYYVSVWGSFYSMNTVLVALIIFDHYSKKCLDLPIKLVLLISVISVVILMGNKFQIFTLFIVYFTIKSILKKGETLKSIFKYILITITVFFILQVVLYENIYDVSLEDTVYSYGMNIPFYLNFLAQPYLYIANNFDNLYTFINHEKHYMYGYNILYNITRSHFFCNLFYEHEMDVFLDEYQKSLKMPLMNTGSSFLDSYRDFGISGIFVYSLVIGFISGLAERQISKKRTFFSVFFYVYVIICLSLSFFTEAFASKAFLVNLFVSLLISSFLGFNIKNRNV